MGHGGDLAEESGASRGRAICRLSGSGSGPLRVKGRAHNGAAEQNLRQKMDLRVF